MMTVGRITLWKLHVLLGGFAIVFALLLWLLGPVGGFLMLILLLPFCSVVFWLFLSERQADSLMTVLSMPIFLLMVYIVAEGVGSAVFGISLPLGNKGLLLLAFLYCFAGLSIGRALARGLRSWGGVGGPKPLEGRKA
jgi:hypothetical protein